MTRSGLIRRALCYLRREDGGAALEFAIWTAFLTPIIVNVVDLALYAYDKVQVANASQSAVQAAWSFWTTNACTGTISNCGSGNSFSNAVKYAVSQSSYLGLSAPSNVTQSSNAGTYCATTGGQLATTSCPSGWTNGYYYNLTVTYTFQPIFHAAPVVNLLPATISQTSWVRLK
jgi:Flp pilus assembly protein TadG